MEKYKIAICVPTHTPLSDNWTQKLQYVVRKSTHDVTVIIIDDSNGTIPLPDEWERYDYASQQESLGPTLYEEFEKLHKSSACRNLGHWLAYRDGYDIVIGLDSDCDVPPNFIADHLHNLKVASHGWVNPIAKTGWFPRGFPYVERVRRTALSMGLWEHELDVNGADRVVRGTPPSSPMNEVSTVAVGILPLCGMNFAAWVDTIPAFLFLPNIDYKHSDGQTFEFRRHDDIFGGYIFQKIMQKMKENIVYGNPVVYHDTIVDAQEDANNEIGMNTWEALFYATIDEIFEKVNGSTYKELFASFAKKAQQKLKETPFEGFIPSILMWKKMFELFDDYNDTRNV